MKIRILAMGGLLTLLGLVLNEARGFHNAYLGISIAGIVFLVIGIII